MHSLMHGLVEFAMWAGLLDIGRNPISPIQNKGATRRTRKARSLAVEQFHALLRELHEPFATLALVSVCLGLRISEALALRWADVDWLGARLSIRRGIVEQVVNDGNTEASVRTFNRTTCNIYGDVVTDEMTTAGTKVAQLAFQGVSAQCRARQI